MPFYAGGFRGGAIKGRFVFPLAVCLLLSYALSAVFVELAPPPAQSRPVVVAVAVAVAVAVTVTPDHQSIAAEGDPGANGGDAANGNRINNNNNNNNNNNEEEEEEEGYLAKRFAEIANRGISRTEDAIIDDDDDIDDDGVDEEDGGDDDGGNKLGVDYDGAAPHDFGILITHYHKTGYVLSRHLTNLVTDLEHRAGGGEKPPQTAKKANAVDYFDETTGLRIAFGTRGSWNSNFVPARRHGGVTGCPMTFELAAGVIHLQESPDLFCGDAHLSRLMLGAMGGGGDGGGIDGGGGGVEEEEEKAASTTTDGMKIKIVHFVRNPFEMASSNYFYHAQDPTVSGLILEMYTREKESVFLLVTQTR